MWLAERWELSERVRRGVEERRVAGRPAPHPAPVVACRVAEVAEVPRAALALQRAVQRAGGVVQVTYAQGYGVHGRTGRPTALRDSIAVRCWGPGGQRLVACWERPVDGRSWLCNLRMVFGAMRPIELVSDERMKTEVAAWGTSGVS